MDIEIIIFHISLITSRLRITMGGESMSGERWMWSTPIPRHGLRWKWPTYFVSETCCLRKVVRIEREKKIEPFIPICCWHKHVKNYYIVCVNNPKKYC